MQKSVLLVGEQGKESGLTVYELGFVHVHHIWPFGIFVRVLLAIYAVLVFTTGPGKALNHDSQYLVTFHRLECILQF
jgi:hypothetical protein